MSKFKKKFPPQRELCSVGIYSIVGSAPYESGVRKNSMIAVVDYQAGNLYNVGHALRYLKEDFIFSGDPEVVEKADKVILPGVGSAQAAMDSLTEQGLVEVLQSLEVPFLGICLGLQLLFEISEEDQTPCLGIFPGRVKKFNKSRVKVPHIGWNQVRNQSGNLGAMTLFNNIPNIIQNSKTAYENMLQNQTSLFGDDNQKILDGPSILYHKNGKKFNSI